MSVEERTRATLLAAAENIHPNTGAMLADVEHTVHRQAIARRAVLGIGALVLAVLAGVLGAAMLGGRPSGAEFDPAEGADREASFTFEEDDLCAWFAPIEVAGFLGAQYEWTGGPDEVVAIPTAQAGGCWWRLTNVAGQDPYQIHVWNAEPRTVQQADVAEADGGLPVVPGETVSGHPALSPGVVVQNAGRGVFVFWSESGEGYLALTLTTVTGAGERVMVLPTMRDEQERHFAFANQLLQGLGWVPIGGNVLSGRAFDISADTLCTWFTRKDMDRVVEVAQDRAGTRMHLASFAPEGSCRIEALPGSWGSSSTTVALQVLMAADTSGFVRHEQLDDSITYANLRDYGNPYSGWAPYGMYATLAVGDQPDMQLGLTVEFWGPSGMPGAEEVDRTELRSLGLAVADELLTAMNWVEE